MGNDKQVKQSYRFTPLDSILHNNIYKNEYLNLTSFTREERMICLLLDSCKANNENETFAYMQFYTNQHDGNLLNLYRIKYWDGGKINDKNIEEVYRIIKYKKHSYEVELHSLSDYIENYIYETLIYINNFRVSTEDLINIYNMNENDSPLDDIAKIMNFDIKIGQTSSGFKAKFREIIKFLLLYYHRIAVNQLEVSKMYENQLTRMYKSIKQNILISYKNKKKSRK